MTGPPAPASSGPCGEDQGPHNPLPDFRLRHKQGPKALRRDDQSFHRTLRMGVNQCRPPRQLGQLAHERTGPIRDDGLAASRLITLGDLDLARQDDCQALADFAHSDGASPVP